MTFQSTTSGIWIPLITPFKAGELDESSLRRLVKHYSSIGLRGFVLAATTGEGQTLDDAELERLASVCADETSHCSCEMPIYLGVSGSDPRKVEKRFQQTKHWPIDGYLISGPNYLRPSQDGVKRHYEFLAGSTERPIMIYNIPYRTGVNVLNETMLELAALPNIVGLKDCCGSPEQSYDLLRCAPKDFSVLTGEDPFFYNAMVHGAKGAILTGAHVLAHVHLEICEDLHNGHQKLALEKWNRVVHIPRLLFVEPSPAPVKHWLWRQGLIDSPEVRLPMLPIGDSLAGKIDAAVNLQGGTDWRI
ncbi:4-hydroxy-tetrahydrodipicolinate synthase [Anderseniella sp. Alg231-50]|uniref:4-hydroxy-tetrahydrodipicolinate synthase n=1 Tax=Anderseniella sp. Alg231-50 TaxID=1922226 RepID=UPI000D54FCD7